MWHNLDQLHCWLQSVTTASNQPLSFDRRQQVAGQGVTLVYHCCRLEDAGYGVGLRLLEALAYRERGSRREVRLIEMLKFVHTTLWKCLFGRQARELEQSNTVGCCSFCDCCTLHSTLLTVNTFVDLSSG